RSPLPSIASPGGATGRPSGGSAFPRVDEGAHLHRQEASRERKEPHDRIESQERNVTMDTTFWVGLFNIVVIDMVLSGDNAVVIGMAARTLPERQRRRAILFGTGAAVFLRVALTGIAAWLLNIPLLMTVGAVLLLWIALKLMNQNGGRTHVSTGRNLSS